MKKVPVIFFLRHMGKDRPFMLGLFANTCNCIIIFGIRTNTAEAYLCSLYCLCVVVVSAGVQLIMGIRQHRQFKATRAQFTAEREVVDFWQDQALAAGMKCQVLEANSASWAEKQEAEAAFRTAHHRYVREVEPIVTKWRKELAEMPPQ